MDAAVAEPTGAHGQRSGPGAILTVEDDYVEAGLGDCVALETLAAAVG